MTGGVSAAVYTADFTTQYLLTVTAGSNGTVVTSLSTSDGYYSPGTSVQLTATPASGYQFSGWSGDLTGTVNPQSIGMVAPQSQPSSRAMGGSPYSSPLDTRDGKRFLVACLVEPPGRYNMLLNSAGISR